MKIDVIIGSYNMGAYLPEAIESLIGQNTNIIIVDDGSTDDTAKVVAKYPVEYVYQANHGCCGASKNRGLRQSTSEFIAFLDADDIAAPDRIEKQAQLLRDNPTVGAVYTDYRDFKPGSEFPRHFETCPRVLKAFNGQPTAILKKHDARDILIKENYALPSALMIRRDVLTVAPGFTTETKVGDDVLFAYQVAHRWDIGLIDYVGAYRRIHGSNISGDTMRFLSQGLIARKLLRATETSPVLQEKLDRWLAERRGSLARELANRGQFRESLGHAIASKNARMIARTLALSYKALGSR